MDSVRFGRALGVGARSAAKALAGAVDAATAPNPACTTASSRANPSPPAAAAQLASRAAARGTTQVRNTRSGIARGSKQFGEAVWGPFAKLSRVLWLEITGSFFGIFALFAGHAVWASHADFYFAFHPTPATHDASMHLLVMMLMTLVFGYFCVSSFFRAYRR